MIDFIWGLIGGIIGIIVGFIIEKLYSYFRSRNGILTGNWEQIIPAQKDQDPKRDQVKCHHVGQELNGTIHRIEPKKHDFKKWAFKGRIIDNLIFLTFWTTDPIKNPGSYGTIQLNSVPGKDPNGFYVKLIMTSDNKQLTGKLEQFDLHWTRVSE